MDDATYEGKTSGKAGVILNGNTGERSPGRWAASLLNPGAEPHVPHRHAD